MYIASTGLVCALGYSADAGCAAMRAGFSGFAEIPFRDNAGAPIIGAPVPLHTSPLGLQERMLQFLAAAVSECISGLSSGELQNIPLLVNLAEPARRGGCSALAGEVIEQLEKRLGVAFDVRGSAVFTSGHAGAFGALHEARKQLTNQSVKACVVCGADSYLNARSLDGLHTGRRLKTEQNSDGVIPGEAAAAVLIHRRSTPASFAQILGLGFGMEQATILSDQPLLGSGLKDAAKFALEEARMGMDQVHFRVSDAAGESYAFKEQSLLVARLLRVRREGTFPLWHCAENLGETGAVAGLLELIVASHAFRKGYAPGTVALCCASSDSGLRAAALLTSTAAANAEEFEA